MPPTWDRTLSAIVSKLRTLLATTGVPGLDVASSFGCYQLRLPAEVWIDIETAAESIDRAQGHLRAGEPAEAWGGREERDNGNGSLMRIAPLSCAVHRLDVATIVARSVEVSGLTHAHPRSTMCCAYFSLLMRGLLGGQGLEAAMRDPATAGRMTRVARTLRLPRCRARSPTSTSHPPGITRSRS